MASQKKSSKKESQTAKLKRLERLARATAKLSLEVFGDYIRGKSIPVPPKPKRGKAVAKGSIPVPPKPKLEALADLAHGALTIEESADSLSDL
jgi:hypothetical protein